MSIPLISNISQKNNGSFWLVDSNAIYGGLYHVNTVDEMNKLPVVRLKSGMMCYIKNNDVYYQYKNNKWSILEEIGDNSIREEEIQEIIGTFEGGAFEYDQTQ